MKALDKVDRQLLDILQQKFPLSVAPFAQIADHIGISEEEVIHRISDLKEEGIIRRIGGVLDTRKLGYYSTLCACILAEEKIDEFVQYCRKRTEITHNYLRDHQLNIWFTITAVSHEDAGKLMNEIAKYFDTRVYSMPAEKVYKIRVLFPMEKMDDVR